MEIFNGAPADLSGRSDRERRVYALLDRLQIQYERVDHPPAFTMEDCEAVDNALGVQMCKNLFLSNRRMTRFYLLLMPGEKPFVTRDLSRQLGISRASFADETHMAELLDLHPGSVSVMGLMNDAEHRVQLIIDRDVLKQPKFCCHPCENTSSICFQTEDLTRLILPALGVSPVMVDL